MKSLWIALSLMLALALSDNCHAQRKPDLASRPELTKAQERTLDQLIKDLDSTDPKTLDEAFQGLINMGPKAAGAIDALTRKLDGRTITYSNHRYRSLTRNFKVGVFAVAALRSIGKAAVPALTGALQNKDEDVRLGAAGAIAEIRQPIELKHWLALLHDSNEYARIIAARQVGKAKDPSGVEPLAKLLRDGDKGVRIEAAKALGELGDEKAIDFLIVYLPEAASRHEYAPSDALARLGRPAIQAVIRSFATFDENTKRPAVVAIQHCDARALRDLLRQCLGSKHGQLREAALYAMLKHTMPEALEAAKSMTDDSYWVARYTTARCLGEMADEKTADSIRPILLKMAMQDKDAKVRNAALDSALSLPTKAPADAWKVLPELLKDESPRVRETAVGGAYAFWRPELAAPLMALLEDPEPAVRTEAAFVLGARQVKEAVPQLVRIFDDSSDRFAMRLAYALAKCKMDETLGSLIEKAKDSTARPALRCAAAAALGHTEDPKAVEALIVAMEDRVQGASIRIPAALKRITGEDYGTNAAKWRAWYERQKQGKRE